MKERIIEIRKENKLSQEDFAKKINITRNAISLIETGNRNASDRTINDICTVFNINEEWLKTGKGEKYKTITINEEIAAFAGSLMKVSDDNFKKRLIEVLAKMTPEQWKLLEEIANGLIKKS